MNTSMKELNMNEMAIVNGGKNKAVDKMEKGILIGGAIGTVGGAFQGGAGGAVGGLFLGGLTGGIAGLIIGSNIG